MKKQSKKFYYLEDLKFCIRMNDEHEKCLLIDDDPIVQLHGIEVLHSIGFDRNKIFTASNGIDAIHFLFTYKAKRGRLPDVLLLDLIMPQTDGFEFLEQAKSIKDISEVDIIIVSDSIDPDDLDRAAKYKVYRYTTKPLRGDILVNLLHMSKQMDDSSK